MKKIFFLLLIAAMCFCQKSSAQLLLGPQAGINFATLTGTSLSVNAKPGWHIGGFISIPFTKHFSLIPSLLYVVDGYKYEYTTTTTTTPTSDTTLLVTEVANVDATLGHLDIPVMLNYFTGETKGLMFQAGLQLSILVTDKSVITSTATVSVNGGDPQPSNPTTDNKVSFNSTSVSLVGGIGYKFSKLLILYTRAITGLANAQEGGFVTDDTAGHNFTFEGGLALSFGAQ